MRNKLSSLLEARTGHFALESGHHSRMWLDLELLFRRPGAARPLAQELAARIAPYQPDVVCGPLVEGALVGVYVAEALGVDFAYAQRAPAPSMSEMFSVSYQLPPAQRALVAGRRVAVVNDVIQAGSAVRATLADLAGHHAEPVVVACLLTLGEAAEALARSAGVPLEALDTATNEIWTPGQCPLCANGAPLVPHPGF
ncbi:MAG: orotate phosphoribosyltransferase [Bryobacterales bacterium]|nr:orotate phosphoribosyltransferase [Bryobacterales bacterium]